MFAATSEARTIAAKPLMISSASFCTVSASGVCSELIDSGHPDDFSRWLAACPVKKIARKIPQRPCKARRRILRADPSDAEWTNAEAGDKVRWTGMTTRNKTGDDVHDLRSLRFRAAVARGVTRTGREVDGAGKIQFCRRQQRPRPGSG